MDVVEPTNEKAQKHNDYCWSFCIEQSRRFLDCDCPCHDMRSTLAAPRASTNGKAEVGDPAHDLGCRDDEGWFIVGDGGYWDVTNACWVEDGPDDTPWTTEHFALFGRVANLLRTPPVGGESRD